MKDWFHLGLGLFALIVGILIAYGWKVIGYEFDIHLVYIGIIAFILSIFIFLLRLVEDDENLSQG